MSLNKYWDMWEVGSILNIFCFTFRNFFSYFLTLKRKSFISLNHSSLQIPQTMWSNSDVYTLWCLNIFQTMYYWIWTCVSITVSFRLTFAVMRACVRLQKVTLIVYIMWFYFVFSFNKYVILKYIIITENYTHLMISSQCI